MPDIDLNTLTAAQGTRIVLPEWISLGRGLSAAGDINHDGIADLMMATQFGVRILYGQAGGFGATLDVQALGTGQQTLIQP